jgi:hypothetical protein
MNAVFKLIGFMRSALLVNILPLLTFKKVDDRNTLEVESSLVGLPDFKSGARG